MSIHGLLYSTDDVPAEVVKGDTNAGPGARATAAGDYVVDKKEQKFHEV